MHVSVVCPFFNEELILRNSVLLMLDNLASLEADWELIIVNDGSRDHSLEIARELEQDYSRLKVVSYANNQGRGHALRAGVAQAAGDIVVTTEIDSSWGDDIAHKILAKFQAQPDADMVIASPNLPGGFYRNVPLKRVLIAKIGNTILRLAQSTRITMYTGMTRGYRREKFLALPLSEDGKEFHLEAARKAQAFGYHIYEVPAILEWKDHKLVATKGQKRKSSSRISKTMATHLVFSFVASPFRYIVPVSAALTLIATILFSWAVYNLFTPDPSIYLLLSSLLLYLFAFLIVTIGVLAYQGNALLTELWRIRGQMTN